MRNRPFRARRRPTLPLTAALLKEPAAGNFLRAFAAIEVIVTTHNGMRNAE
jgi:hypothetical protein